MAAVSQSSSSSDASWLTVGLSGGHAALADPRTGELGAFWRAHEGGLTCLAACSEHSLVTGSQVCSNGCIDNMGSAALALIHLQVTLQHYTQVTLREVLQAVLHLQVLAC